MTHSTSMIESLNGVGILNKFRHSLAGFFNVTRWPEGSIQHRTAAVIYTDRMDKEAAVQETMVVPNTPVKKRFVMSATLIDMPIWSFVKDGVVLPTVYQQVVLGTDNRNGILSAFKMLVKGLKIIRPDGSTKIDLEKHTANLDINKIWQYYHRNKSLPEDGILVEFDLTTADIQLLEEMIQPCIKDAVGGIVISQRGRTMSIRKGDRFNLRMTFRVTELEE